MRYCSNKDVNQLVRELVQAGWTFRCGRHGKLVPPSGLGFITISQTPSDHRCLLKIRRDIRRLQRGAGQSEQAKIVVA
ncbi:hypothetical protein C8261_02550 [Pseudothauera lacus]|uniref:Type II toxin-antitoxin system HicA family toxin n=2 Tax=Pseudothauera lacus TaxID=2136175 RepID=A0A2T4IIH7_9RHOO|nr:hypothetical protein C8261_02550 [Pseudothauera lacus]